MSTRAKIGLMMASLEQGNPDGKTQVELEYVYFGKLTDLSQLEKADEKHEQEQWEIRVDGPYRGNVRVRCTDGNKYVLCSKIFQPGELGKLEVEMPCTKDFFEHVKKLATGGMTKTRYIFKIPDSAYFWEVDVYRKPDGSIEEWCKIDLEVKSEDYKIPEFPVTMTDTITAQPKDRSESQWDQINELMKSKFVLRNAYLKPAE